MTCPSIFIRRLLLSVAVAQAPPSVLPTLASPMLQPACDSVSSSSLAVWWTAAVPPVALTYSQYIVLGCSVTSSGVVNVIRFHLLVSAVEVVRGYSAVSPGRPALSSRMETCGVGVSAATSRDRYNCALVRW